MLRKLQHILIMIRIAQVITTIYITVDMRNFQNTLMTPFPHQTPSQCRISKDVNGGGGGRGGDRPPYTHPRYLAYVHVSFLSLSELLERIHVSFLNNNRGSPRGPWSRIIDTFVVFYFNLIIIK